MPYSFSDTQNEPARAEWSTDLKLSNWLWRPWYAKLWWALLPSYWLAVSEPTRPAFMDWYADIQLAAYIHAFFTPVVAVVVLGSGYVRRAAAEGRIGAYSARRRTPFDDRHPDSPFTIHHRPEEWNRRPHKNS